MESVRTKIACLAVGAAAIAGLSLAGTAASAPPFALEFAGLALLPLALGAAGGDLAVDSEGNVGGGRHREPGRQVRLQRLLRRGVHAARVLATPFADLNGLGADDRGGVYVVDDGSRVVKMDLLVAYVRTYGAGALTSASDVAVAADGAGARRGGGPDRALPAGRHRPSDARRCPPPSTGATSPSPPRASST